jgi:Sulfatase
MQALMSVVTPTVRVSGQHGRWLWGLAIAVALILATHVSQYEGGNLDILFTLAAPATLGAALLLATRRPLFSLVATTLSVGIIFVVSKAKQEAMNMVLHAYDIIFYFSSWSTITFLAQSYRIHLTLFVCALLGAGLISALAWRADIDRVKRTSAFALMAVLAATTLAAAHLRTPLHVATFFTDDRYISQFFGSITDTLSVLWRGNLVEAAPSTQRAPFGTATTCTPQAKPPNIVLIHQESTVPPSNFPNLAYDTSIDPFFQSHDGRLHKLRVETYAGASWLSEFSILTGMSSHAFGSMRPYVQSVMAGKFRDALPQFLERCGYRNVLVYPMLRNFVANARFYDKIGLHKVIDAKDQNAKRPNERDRFYYNTGLTEFAQHRQSSDAPMFLYIQTQASHAEYNFTYEPHEKVAGGAAGGDPEVHEYLRRLGLAARDYKFLKQELAARFPNEQFLIINYGDHHPDVTRRLLGADTYRGTLTMDRHQPAFTTYYSVDGVGYTPAPTSTVALLDVPYLPVILLEAAGLPLPDTYRERRRLLELCNGRYHGCTERNEILAFHRRLLNSDLLDRF